MKKIPVHQCTVLCLDEDECFYAETRGTDYKGTVSVTMDGHLCQRWDSFQTSVHSYTADNLYPDGSRSKAK